MSEPHVASRTPIAVEVVAGQKYWWCACGLSRSQPFCDGSHKGSAFQPLAFVAERSERLWLCGCKRTAGQPRCDGSHKALAADGAA
ncbi:MAG: CDGSH iron-sulfur domain-containing protein [Xanthomonadaceae bacterium]|jgi:CDGSH-type Zn-finger protein|nr:CDGSH iron-sulfur domain-containing protein [Xanthomonadaceae bacterium]